MDEAHTSFYEGQNYHSNLNFFWDTMCSQNFFKALIIYLSNEVTQENVFDEQDFQKNDITSL